MGQPQAEFTATHVAGSNGKGSCCVILANAYTLNGVCTGLFTSPHLCFVEERIRIDGVPITAEEFDAALREVRNAATEQPAMQPTYYEATFLAAMVAFREAGVERAIVETGLGGRLDPTILTEADCCIITEIALEHTEILGHTLGEIAKEKAAIIRKGAVVVARWSYDTEVRAAIEAKVTDDSRAWWWRYDRDSVIQFEVAHESHRPIRNKQVDGYIPYLKEAACLAEASLFNKMGPKSTALVNRAVMHTHWPGRMQWIEHSGVKILLDAAHNASGMSRACAQVLIEMQNNTAPSPGIIIFGCSPQQDLFEFTHPLIELVSACGVEYIIATQPLGGRYPPVHFEEIAEVLASQSVAAKVVMVEMPEDALIRAIGMAEQSGAPIMSIGSLYLAGNLLQHLGLDDRESMTTLKPPKDEFEVGKQKG
jgi:dihydrofolate synthase/folylpolyglutamate synthase